MTQWKRMLSGLLALCLMLGIVVPIAPVHATESIEPTNTVIYENDFETTELGSSPVGWEMKQVNSPIPTTHTVHNTDGSNRVLVVEKGADPDTTVNGSIFFYKKLSQNYSEMTLSYSVRTGQTGGTLHLPTFGTTADNGYDQKILDLVIAEQKFKYSADGATYNEVTGCTVDTWYTVKIVYTYAENAATCRLYINGVEQEVAVRRNAQAGCIALRASDTANTKYYIDNVKLTTGDHTPAVPAVYENDFEDMEVGTPSDWTVTYGTEGGFANAVADSKGNHVLDLSRTDAAGKAWIHQSIKASTKLTMTYDVKAKLDAGFFYLPTFGTTASNGYDLRIVDVRIISGNFVQFATNGSTQTQLMAFTADKWYTVKIIYEKTASGTNCEMYIDGQKLELSTTNTGTEGATATYIRNAEAGCIATRNIISGTGTAYIDNIKVTAADHEPATPIIVNQNFDDMAVGTIEAGWTALVVGGDTDTTTNRVQYMGTNRVLEVKRSAANSGVNTFLYQKMDAAYDKLTLSYHVSVADNSGTFYLPTLGTNAANGYDMRILSMTLRPDGFFLEKTGGAWKQISTCTPKRWYAVQIDYEKTATGTTCKLYFDGKEVDLTDAAIKNANAQYITTRSTSTGVGSLYVDNVCLTVGGHVPAAAGAWASGYWQDFEKVDALPSEWVIDKVMPVEGSVTVEKEDDGNKVLKIDHTNTTTEETSNFKLLYTHPEEMDMVHLQYRFKIETNNGAIYLPDPGGVFMIVSGTKLFQDGNTAKSKSLTVGKWYEVDVRMDTATGTFDFYLDGELFLDDAARSSGSVNSSKTVSIQVPRKIGGVFYLDDIQINELEESNVNGLVNIYYDQDFEGISAVPSEWTVTNPLTEINTVSIATDAGGNQHLEIAHMTNVTELTTQPIKLVYKYEESLTKLVLKYRFKIGSDGGALYLPNPGGVFMIAAYGELFQNGKNEVKRVLIPDKWYQVEVRMDTTSGTFDFYLDGELFLDDAARVDNSTSASSGLTIEVNRRSVDTFALDDIQIYELKDVYYQEQFEDETELPAQWQVTSPMEGNNEISVITKSGNKFLQFDHSDAQNVAMSMTYTFPTDMPTDRLVTRFDVQIHQPTQVLYLPGPDGLNLRIDGRKLSWTEGFEGITFEGYGVLAVDTWHNIEIALDGKNGIYDVYLDGKLMLSGAREANLIDLTKWTISLGKDTTDVIWLDNLAVEEYVEAKEVVYNQTSYVMGMDQTLTLTPDFLPTDAARRGVDYTSNDTTILTVDAYGKVTSLANEGTTTITADPMQDGLDNVTITIEVKDMRPVAVTGAPSSVTLPQGGHVQYTFGVQPAYAPQDLVMTSSDPSVATIDEWGEIVAVGVGTATITVAAESDAAVKAQFQLTVEARPAVMQTVYVDPVNGDDTNDGTESNPVKTLQKAQELVRAANDDMTGDIEVILAEGYYQLTETWKLDAEDGGSNNHYVTWKANGEAIIGGKKDITGFTDENGDGIYVATVPEGFNTRQLFVNGVRATRARSEAGLLNPTDLLDGTTRIGYISDNVEIADYAKPQDLELVFIKQWTNSRCGVDSVAYVDGRVNIILDPTQWKLIMQKGSTKPTVPVYYENALELLDEPGEWYLDSEAGKLYYMPRAWENITTAEVIAPAVEELVVVEGKDYDSMVQNIAFEGITFADTTWLRPSTENGHNDTQNNHLRNGSVDTLPGGSVIVRRANSIPFTGCTFTRLGCSALQMVKGVQNSPIIGCTFYDISGSAINIGDPLFSSVDTDNYNPKDIRMLMKNNDVINNYIHDIGVEYKSAAAVSVGFAADMNIAHNEIFNIPYSGVHTSYGYERRFENVLKNMVVEYNFIHDLMHDGIYDGGAIYNLGNTGGNNIARYNYLKNQGGAYGVLYSDGGTTNWTWDMNVIDLTEVDIWDLQGVKLIEPQWTIINPWTDNLQIGTIYTTTANMQDDSGGIPECPNPWTLNGEIKVYPNANWPIEAQNVINQTGLEAEYTALRRNYAERYRRNFGSEIVLTQNGTFQITVEAENGREVLMPDADVKVYYRVIDDSIATVSANGLITAKAAGKTKIEVSVICNDILEVYTSDLYIGDYVDKLVVDDITRNTIYTVMGENLQIKVHGITDMDRYVEPVDNLTYVVADETIAAINSDGVITPLKTGKTTVTITRDVGEHTAEVSVSLEVDANGTFDGAADLDGMFAANNNQWTLAGNNNQLTITDGEKVSGYLHGYGTYTGSEYHNELLTFSLNIDTSTGTADWPSIVLRAANDDAAVASGRCDGYIICFCQNYGLQIQRCNGPYRVALLGWVEGLSAQDDFVKNPLTSGVESKVNVGITNVVGGVRIYIEVDGVTVVDIIDDSADAIRAPGYFGLVGRGETITLRKHTHTGEAEWIQTDTTHTKAYPCCGEVVVAEEMHEWEGNACSECGYVREAMMPDINITGGAISPGAATVTAPEGGWGEGENTFTVASDKVCVVAVKNADGSYTRLEATLRADGGYQFTVELAADSEIAVVVAGDANNDGKLSISDAVRMRAALLGNVELSAIETLASDAGGNGLSIADVVKMRAVLLGNTQYVWTEA